MAEIPKIVLPHGGYKKLIVYRIEFMILLAIFQKKSALRKDVSLTSLMNDIAKMLSSLSRRLRAQS